MEILDKAANVVISEVVNPLIYVFSALAFVWFLYGVFLFLMARVDGKEDGIKAGKNHMLWGLIGLVIIYSASAIYTFITSFFN